MCYDGVWCLKNSDNSWAFRETYLDNTINCSNWDNSRKHFFTYHPLPPITRTYRCLKNIEHGRLQNLENVTLSNRKLKRMGTFGETNMEESQQSKVCEWNPRYQPANGRELYPQLWVKTCRSRYDKKPRSSTHNFGCSNVKYTTMRYSLQNFGCCNVSILNRFSGF